MNKETRITKKRKNAVLSSDKGIEAYRKKPIEATVHKQNVVLQFVSGVDRPFLITIILLLCIGTVMVFSASYAYAKENMGDSYHFAKLQIIWALSGIVIMAVVARFVNYRFIRFWTKPVFAIALLLMMAVLVVGSAKKGAQRWIQVGPISVQPSEIMKFAVVLLFADYIDKYQDKITSKGKPYSLLLIVLPCIVIAGIGVGLFMMLGNKIIGAVLAVCFLIGAVLYAIKLNMKKNAPDFYYGILPFLIVLGVVGFLLYKQPHLSGLIITASIIFAMMFIGGSSPKYLGAGIGLGGVGALLLAVTMEHASARLKVWKDPFAYFTGDGWQPSQSLLAIGSGGFWGVGFGNSRQKHLYLPEPQNDYIFSIWCEEMGFFGALLVICIFVYFVYRGIVIGLRAPDRFSSLLVMGIVIHVGIQMILNIAVITNSLPSTGVSLPFFSYGGTSLLILMAEMGVILSVSRYSTIEKT